MVWVEALIPFDKGELLNTIHRVGMVDGTVSIYPKAFHRMLFTCFVNQHTILYSNTWKLQDNILSNLSASDRSDSRNSQLLLPNIITFMVRRNDQLYTFSQKMVTLQYRVCKDGYFETLY